MAVPALEPLEGWVAEALPAGVNRSFVSGDPEGERLRVRYFRDAEGNKVARVWFGPAAEGPPGHAHGGSLAAVLDEAMGACCWARGYPVLAGTLTVMFRRPVPLGTVAVVRTAIAGVEGRKVSTTGRIEADGVLHAEATGVFVILDAAGEASFREAAATGRFTPPDRY